MTRQTKKRLERRSSRSAFKNTAAKAGGDMETIESFSSPESRAKRRRQSDSAIQGVQKAGLQGGPSRRSSRNQVGLPGRQGRDTGRSITIPHRVSQAYRSEQQAIPASATSEASRKRGGSGVARKRANSKTANPRGKFSKPDTGAVFDKQTRARAQLGRRNKHTATVKALKKA